MAHDRPATRVAALARWLLLLLLVGPRAQAAENGTTTTPPAGKDTLVVDVRVVGNRNLPLTKIVPHIRTRTGRPFSLETVQDDVRRLNQTRLFVPPIKTFYQKSEGGVVVVFEVLERPLMQYVKYIGNGQIATSVLKKEAALKQGDPFDPLEVEEARRKLEALYHEKGYSRARVTLLEGNRAEDRGAIFLINEAQKQRVLWTKFVGNTIASESRLRTQIESKPGILWIFKGEVDSKKIDEDINRLTAYYRGLGFFRAKVGRELEFTESNNWLVLTFVIDEGPRYKIRNVSVVGNTKFQTSELTTDLKLSGGKFFNQGDMTADVRTMQDMYGGIGYVFANVQADPRFLEEPGQLDLVYKIEEGDRYKVGKVNVQIKGDAPRTKVTTVWNRMSLRPGDVVDTRELRDSERRLKFSGLFKNDPASGTEPKITFQPPDRETEVARDPKPRKPQYRGQSPDEALPPVVTPQGDRVLDLTLHGEWAPQPDPAAGPPAPADGQAVPAVYQQPAEAQPAVQPPQPAGGPTSSIWPQPLPYRVALPQRSDSAPETSPAVDELQQRAAALQAALDRPSVAAPLAAAPPAAPAPLPGLDPSIRSVRFQYSTDGGYATPPLPQQPRATAVPARTVSQPTATNPPVYGAAPTPAPAYQVNQAPAAAAGPSPFAGVTGDNGAQQFPTIPAPTDGPVFDRPQDLTRPLDLTPQIMETETGRFMLGVGINSDAGLVGQVTVDERNFDWTRIPTSWEDIRSGTAFRGAGQGFRLELVPGTVVQRYTINFTEPYLFDTDYSLGLSGFYYDRIYREWTEQRVGGRVSTGYQFSHDLSGRLSFRGERVTIYNPISTTLPELNRVVGHPNTLLGFGAGVSHDTRDSSFLPTEGHLIEFNFEQVIGTFQYPHAELDLRRHFTVWQRPDGSGRHVLSLMGRVGATGEDTPIYDNYYAGGFSTIRGFTFRSASPKKQDIFVGGQAMVLASAEYMFPITADDMLRGVVFCDSGAVEPSFRNWTDNYRVAPGFGLRITIPALGPAPIALDFAFPVAVAPGDRVENFSFFIGIGR